MSKWTVNIETDPENGDLMLPLTDEMLAQVGWVVGDTIEWVDNKDGSWTMRKTDETSTNAIK